MRTVLGAIAFSVMTCGSAAASSFIVIGEPAAGQSSSVTPADSSSFVYVGEPFSPVAAASPKKVDGTETASVGDPRADATPHAGVNMTLVEAVREWDRVSSLPSQSMVFFGTPDPADYKTVEPEVATHEFDASKLPMVMRGGLLGDLFAAPGLEVEPAAAAVDPQTGDSKLSRREKREKAREEAEAAAAAAAAPQLPPPRRIRR